MEQLINDKAAISCDLNVSLRQLSDNLELVDKVSIDCDVWRSKYLASRLMIDELASVKREVSHHLVSSQQALVCMLAERDRLSEVLSECNAQLRGITSSGVYLCRGILYSYGIGDCVYKLECLLCVALSFSGIYEWVGYHCSIVRIP